MQRRRKAIETLFNIYHAIHTRFILGTIDKRFPRLQLLCPLRRLRKRIYMLTCFDELTFVTSLNELTFVTSPFILAQLEWRLSFLPPCIVIISLVSKALITKDAMLHEPWHERSDEQLSPASPSVAAKAVVLQFHHIHCEQPLHVWMAMGFVNQDIFDETLRRILEKGPKQQSQRHGTKPAKTISVAFRH